LLSCVSGEIVFFHKCFFFHKCLRSAKFLAGYFKDFSSQWFFKKNPERLCTRTRVIRRRVRLVPGLGRNFFPLICIFANPILEKIPSKEKCCQEFGSVLFKFDTLNTN
jgi:hypothetical protein